MSKLKLKLFTLPINELSNFFFLVITFIILSYTKVKKEGALNRKLEKSLLDSRKVRLIYAKRGSRGLSRVANHCDGVQNNFQHVFIRAIKLSFYWFSMSSSTLYTRKWIKGYPNSLIFYFFVENEHSYVETDVRRPQRTSFVLLQELGWWWWWYYTTYSNTRLYHRGC